MTDSNGSWLAITLNQKKAKEWLAMEKVGEIVPYPLDGVCLLYVHFVFGKSFRSS